VGYANVKFKPSPLSSAWTGLDGSLRLVFMAQTLYKVTCCCFPRLCTCCLCL